MRSGFTLLETLIALVIASLITLVLMDSLSAAAGHAARLEQAAREHTARTLGLLPARRALEGAIADYHDGDALFTGEARRMRGLTLAGAGGAHAGPVVFEIDITAGAGAARLIYTENGDALFEIAVPVGARLAYRDARGGLHDVWPPEDGFDPDPVYYRPLPAAVVILDGETAVMAAAPSRTAPLTLRSSDLELLL